MSGYTTTSPMPLRVCVWGPVPPPPGGVSQWVTRYVTAAPGAGLDVKVINTSPPSGSAFSERSRFELGRVAVAGRALTELAATLHRWRPEIAHVTTTLFWATPRESLALAMLRAAGVPTVLHLHASNQLIAWRDGLGPLRRKALDACLRSATTVLVLSEELERYLRAALPGLKVARIGNPVATAPPPDGATIPIFQPTARVRVLFVGALTPLKGVAELCEAVLASPSLELVLVGERGGALDAAAGERMDAAMAALRATGRLIETGHIPHDEVLRAYRACDIFCLPSHREGMPNVLLEAMAAGLPCVVTPVGAIPEVVADEADVQVAEVVPVNAPGRLAKALTDLAADPARRAALGDAARARIDSSFAEAAVMTAYRVLYQHILAAAPTPSR